MKNMKVLYDNKFMTGLEEAMKQDGPFSSWELFSMAYEAELTTMTSDFKGFLSLKYLPHMEFLSHQINAAQQVIENMNGRAILADEVGLGKTIEAGLILKEYMVRGVVKKALLLVPASLVNQWVQELNEKFHIPAIAHRKNYSWEQHNILVTSLDTAKKSPHQEQILEIDYDLVLVDEAHKIKNHKTKNYELVRALKKKYCLLLTATPVQNELIEIFNLVSILKPGHLGSYEAFVKRFGKDRSKLKENEYLKKLVKKVMVRHTRENTNMNPTKRHIETVWVTFSKEEKSFYEQLDTAIGSIATFAKLTLLREICSSREACYLSMSKMAEKNPELKDSFHPFIKQIEQLPAHAKAEQVVRLINQFPNEKVIIFTEYRASQLYLQWYLQQNGISSVPYRGGFNRGKKDWMRQLFENQVQVLIATEAGGEGINLQFCNRMINYDLPWNPMRLEQRIGRIHRFGQEKDVHIYNFAIKDTIEEHIMKLLYEKLGLFEQVIGRLDSILEVLNITDMEQEIEAIMKSSASTGEIKIKLDNLSSVIHHTAEFEQKVGEQYGNF
ncbi:DEAD/DEAH box helicase [Virgibacillus soli]|uniref:SNF2-related protein n=1 Tax=Paracerasibacillus soli TaxID=480284 RepID=A0ABU5CQD3_9BACI|nr:SNF2-related protein [Virgibacillus soli]MDY0408425.1 SNF2-related protein [Virgibacillus soli]